MVTNVPEQLQTPMNRCEQPQSCAVRHTNRLTEEHPQNAPDPSHIRSGSPLTSSAAYDAPYRRQPHQRRTKPATLASPATRTPTPRDPARHCSPARPHIALSKPGIQAGVAYHAGPSCPRPGAQVESPGAHRNGTATTGTPPPPTATASRAATPQSIVTKPY